MISWLIAGFAIFASFEVRNVTLSVSTFGGSNTSNTLSTVGWIHLTFSLSVRCVTNGLATASNNVVLVF